MDKKVFSIDDHVQAETYEQKVKKVANEIKESIDKEGLDGILTGKVSGVETVQGMPVAVIYIEMFKVIIPAVEFMDVVVKENNDPMNLYRMLMNASLGAEVDFMVKVVDEEQKLAIASRKEAMKRISQDMYFRKQNDEYLIQEGAVLEARVFRSMVSGIIVEAFGKEVYIPPKELSYSRVHDARKLHSPGERVMVKVLSINRKDNDVTLSLSVKQASDNPLAKIIEQYNVGDMYTGIVTMIDGKNVFIRLDGGIDVLCKYPDYGLNPVIDSEVVVRITLKNTDMNRLFGIITNISRM